MAAASCRLITRWRYLYLLRCRTRQLIADADCVLAIGTELGPTDYDFYENGEFAIPGRLIRVDIDARQASRFIAADLTIIADAAETSAALLAELAPSATQRPGQNSGAARAAEAGRDIDELSQNYKNYINIWKTYVMRYLKHIW